jgi:hypothetical protein
MTITTQDIQLYQPQVLDDTDNGGGRMSPNQVVDGELNNLFDDQSRFDRVTGRVSLRKGWMAVISENRTKLLGAHAILLQRALDPNVHLSMFARDDHPDRRLDAQAHLEQYLAAGATQPFYCWDTQPEGALIVTLLTELGNAVPSNGDVVVFSVERGTVNVGMAQFARAVKIETSEVSATIPPNFAAKTLLQIDITIDQPLRFDLPGEIFGFTQFANQKTLIRRTTLAGGKRYYSIHPITAPVTAGDTTVQIDTILTPVVPSAQQETGIVDQQVGSDTVALVPIGDPGTGGVLTESAKGVAINANAAVILTERAMVPGTVQVSIRPTGGGTAKQHVLTDNGRGALVRDASSGASVPAECAGVIDYRFGQITVTGMSDATGTLDPANSSSSYRAAAAVADVQHTDGIEIDLNNRGLVYTRTLVPKPAPASLQVEYRTLGRWITLRDRGDGTIAGNAGEGSGTINYATGSINLTLGNEPDVGSHVLFGWGTGAHYAGPTGPVQARVPELVIQLAEAPVTPGTLSLTYDISGTPYTVTDDGAGALTGDGSGTINYQTGIVAVRLTQVPASGTSLTASYDTAGNRYTEMPTPGGSAGTVTLQLANGSVDPNSVRLRTQYSTDLAASLGAFFDLEIIDDGAGNMIVRRAAHIPNVRSANFVGKDIVVGTMSYASGLISLDETVADAVIGYTYQGGALGTWSRQAVGVASILFETLTDARYSSAGTPVAQQDAVTITELAIELEGDDLLYGLQPGSLWVEFNGRRYYDRGGVLYYRDDNGNEIQAGAANYDGGLLTITAWPAGTGSGALRGALSIFGRWPMLAAFWRVPAERVKSASYQLTYLRAGQVTPDQATADNAGDIVGAGGLVGSINVDTGVYTLAWTEEVVPEETRYNAVSIAFLPLDPEIIGLDPVRLSTDGRIPTVQTADVAVIHNTQETTLPNPVVAGSTYALRPAISVVELRDQEDVLIPTDRYTVDKMAGEITFANPLDLDGFVQPLIARHRIEDMLLVVDAQLSGLVGLNSQLTHDYPADTSFLSSALPLGNELQAASFNVFSQAAWTGEWSDTLIGDAATGQYNDVVAPILTTNRGAIRERWRVEFTSVTAFRVIGETVGQVGTGEITLDCAPINPATGAPYFTLQAAGWSAGWNVGNQVRFNTEAAARPIWFNRTTLPGPLTDPTDRVQIELRGDAN